MLDHAMKQQLKAYLANISEPIELHLNLDDSAKSTELKSLAEDIAALSELVSLDEARDTDKHSPQLLVRSPQRDTHIAFAGVPMGHEFSSLVLALLHSGGYPVKEDTHIQEQVKNLSGEFNFEVYVSLGCQTCPDVVQALNMMAALNPAVRTTMIDGEVFQDEIEARNIMAVPTVFLNGEKFSQGRLKVTDILRKVDSSAVRNTSAALSNKAPYDMLIVGAGPAGASAAIYAARKGLRTGLVTETFGGQVLDTLGIENFVSVKATEGPKLVSSLEEHVRDYEVDIMEGQRAASITSRDEKGLIGIELESGARLQTRSLLIATGARWKQINVPGEQQYKGHGVAYCPHCDGPLFKGKKVAVIGGGNSGMEAAIDLAGIVEHVTVLEFAPELKADQVLVNKARSMSNITVVTNAQTLSINGDGKKVESLSYRDRNTGEEITQELSGVFVQIGLVPNSEFVKGALELTPFGEIVTNDKGETSVPGVFAAGDVTASAYKQIIIAMGSGANAALGAFDHLIRNSVSTEQDSAEAA